MQVGRAALKDGPFVDIRRFVLILVAIFVGDVHFPLSTALAQEHGSRKVLRANELEHLSHADPGTRIAYGDDPLQFGELHLPEGTGPFPVILYFHGGCWLAEFGDLTNTRPLAHALASIGVAVWNVEYRRVGNPGAGWPGTFLDAAIGTDHLRELSKDYSLDLNRVIAMGHSVGGHLALWVAARMKLPKSNPLHLESPLPIASVVALAPVPELSMMWDEKNCDTSVAKLLGGSPTEFPLRYDQMSLSSLSPLGLPQRLILGTYDRTWAPNGRQYVAKARAAGDRDIRIIEAAESGHFEMMDPSSSTWPLVRAAVLEALNE